MSCPDCGFNRKFQEFIPNDYSIELSEDIERKECPIQIVKVRIFLSLWQKKIQWFIP